MDNLQKYTYLMISVVFAVVAIAISLQASISFYDMKYGRNLIFTGTSKYILALSVFSLSLGFLLIYKDKNKSHETLEKSITYLVPFMFSIALLVLAYAAENNVF